MIHFLNELKDIVRRVDDERLSLKIQKQSDLNNGIIREYPEIRQLDILKSGLIEVLQRIYKKDIEIDYEK